MKKAMSILLVALSVLLLSSTVFAWDDRGCWASNKSRGQRLYIPTNYADLTNVPPESYDAVWVSSNIMVRNTDSENSIRISSIEFRNQYGEVVASWSPDTDPNMELDAYCSASFSPFFKGVPPPPFSGPGGQFFYIVYWESDECVSNPVIGSYAGTYWVNFAEQSFVNQSGAYLPGQVLEERRGRHAWDD